jgi:replicative DNA helicase
MTFNKEAKQYMDLGFSIIPIGKDKKPLVKWEEYQKRKMGYSEFEELTNGKDVEGIAVVTGAISGITVMDIDEGAEDIFADFAQSGVFSKSVPIAITGGGGKHYYFAYTEGLQTSTKIAGNYNIDCRNNGGYVLLPPSKHPSGNTYKWVAERSIFDVSRLVGVPKGLLLSAVEQAPNEHEVLTFSSTVPEGSRNDTIAKVAGQLLHYYPKSKWDYAYTLLEGFNQGSCKPPLDERELKTIFQSISRKAEQNPQVEEANPMLVNEYELANSLMASLDQRILKHKRGELIGLQTGFKHLDYITTGFRPSLIVVSAITSLGKTSFVKQLSDQLLEHNPEIAVLYVTYEQTAEELATKTISRETGISMRNLQAGKLTDADREKVAKTLRDLDYSQSFYTLEATATTTIEDIKKIAEGFTRSYEQVVVVIDYLQLVPSRRNARYTSDKEKIDSNLSELRRLSNSLKSPVIAISSINRSSYDKSAREGEDPSNSLLSSFKESGNIEYSADLAIAMIEDTQKSENSKIKHRSNYAKSIGFYIIKNRNGARGKIEFSFLPETQKFIEETKPIEDINIDEAVGIFSKNIS